MSNTSTNNSEHFLYSYVRALDETLDLGVLPHRFWRILYPLYRIEVEGTQRPATDFEPIELFMERGIEEGELHTIEELESFFGLDSRFVSKLVNRLQAIGHISLDKEQLSLTELGHQSLRDGCCYQRLQTKHVLYFDAFMCQPLRREHYRLHIIDMHLPAELHFFTPLFPFNDWDPMALKQLMKRNDRLDYNVPDEVEELRPALNIEGFYRLAYLPVYVVERQPNTSADLPRLLAFSMIKGRRDDIIEFAINSGDETLAVTFGSEPAGALQDEVAAQMIRRGHREHEWLFNPSGTHGPQLTLVSPSLAIKQEGMDLEDNHRLTLLDVGRFISVGRNNYCVWVTCDDFAIRQRAVSERTLDWLRRSTYRPPVQRVQQRITFLGYHLSVPTPSIENLLQIAETRRLGRLTEWLEDWAQNNH